MSPPKPRGEPLNPSPVFSKRLLFWPLRVASLQWTRKFLLRKSGAEQEPFSYAPLLEKFPHRLVFLPNEVGELAVHLPFLLHLAREAEPQKLLFFCPEEHQHLIKGLQLDSFTFFYRDDQLRYGDEIFTRIQTHLRSTPWDLCLFLDSNYPLIKLFLARYSHAPYRIAIQAEEHAPFVNISLRPRFPASLYSRRTCLLNHFKLSENELVEAARNMSVHRSRTGSPQDSHSHLSSSHVLLLNMEPSRVTGQPWSEQELIHISDWLGNKYRLLALFQGGVVPAHWANILEKLQIRIAPIPSTSGALVDLVRQYKALVTLDSPHAHLALNLTSTPILVLQDGSLEDWQNLQASSPQVKILERTPFAPCQTPESLLGSSSTKL